MFKTKLFFSDDSPSPLGRVRMAGTVASSTGIEQRRLDSYAIVLAVAGAGRYSDEGGTAYEIEPGHLLILFPGFRHSYGPKRGERWDEFYVVFDGPVFEFLESSRIIDRSRPVVLVRPFEPVLADLMKMSAAPRAADRRGRAIEVCGLLRILLTIVIAGSPELTWLELAKKSLSANLDQVVEPEAVAAEVGMGYESFRKRFRLATRMTPTEYRNARRVETARELLSSTSLTIKQIASNLGYYDEYHFSRRFHAAVGLAPGAFRRKVRAV